MVGIMKIEIDVDKEITDEGVFIDEVGGCHEGGCGWNPNGVFCGECSNSTCKGCVNENAEK